MSIVRAKRSERARLWLLCATALALLVFAADLADAAEARLRIYYDQSRWFRFRTAKGARRYFKAVDLSLASISGEVLRPYDVAIVSGHPERGIRPPETAALRRFVERGGGLLIYRRASGDLAAAFGFEFLDTAGGAPIRLERPGRGGSVWPETTWRIDPGPNGEAAMTDAQGRPVAAVRRWGRGRVFALNGGRLVRRYRSAEKTALRRGQLRRIVDWLGALRVGDRSRPRLRTGGFGLHPGEKQIGTGAFRVRYSENLPATGVEFLSREVPRIFRLLTEEFGTGAGGKRSLWVLPCRGSGFTSGRTVGVAGCGSVSSMRAVLIHEMANSLCFDTPVWLGDGGFSRVMHSRIRRKLGGETARRGRLGEKRLLRRWREYEEKNGPYDLSSGRNYAVGAGKLLYIINELESRHGGNLVRAYFRSARAWQRRLKARGVKPLDRMAFYFSAATGEDLFPYFRDLGLPVSSGRGLPPIPSAP